MTSLYAADPGSAESQKHNAKSTENTGSYPPKRVDGHDNPDVGSGSPYRQHYEPAADIWRLYLKETEAEDMELAQLWQIGLDQLLIFAGLFGAILTAFLIESRKDLKADPLQQILQALSNDSVSEPFRPSRASLVVNAVWFSSLGLTLISALSAVLAKGWLAQYTPATPGIRSNDACERHLRYLRSREWPLAAIVGGIPLIIQLALLLFAAGLVVFTADDNLGISFALLAMTVLTVCLYFVATILPWLSPACPFQTTMSDFIPGVARNRRYANPVPAENQSRSKEKLSRRLKRAYLQLTEFLEKVRRKPEQVEIEADILAWIFTNSTHEMAIEEAVRAVAGAKPTRYLRDALHECGADKVLCERFVRYIEITPKFPVGNDEGLRVEAYLYAMLRIVEPSGEIGASTRLLLDAGQTLYRWDSFVDYLQPLACALRIRLLLSADIDDHAERWDQTKSNLIKLGEIGLVPDVRSVLVRATLDGLHEGRIQLQKTCAIILCKQFQIPAARKMIASFDHTLKPGHTVAKKLMRLLQHSDHETSTVILGGIETLARFSYFRESIAASIPLIIAFLKDDIAQEAGASTLANLAEHADLRESIRTSIPKIVEFLQDNNQVICRAGSDTFQRLSEQASLQQTILTFIPQIIELLTDKNNIYARKFAVDTVAKLSEQVIFRDSILVAIPRIVEFLTDEDEYARSASVSALAKLSEKAEFRESITATLPQILSLLKDDHWFVSHACRDALPRLSEQAEFRDFIQVSIPHITNLLQDDNNYAAREAAAITLGKLSEQAELRQAIKASLPPIVDLLKDSSWSLRCRGADVLAQLSQHAEFREIICAALPHVLDLLKDDSTVRVTGAYTLSKLLGHADFRTDFEASLPRILEFLNDNDSDIRMAGADALQNLSEPDEFREFVRDAIPHVVDFLKDTNYSHVRQAGADTLAKLSEQFEFRQSIQSFIPQIADLLKDNDSNDARRAGANALVKLSEQTELRKSVGTALRSFIDHPASAATPLDWSQSFPTQINLDDRSREMVVAGGIDTGTGTRFQTYRNIKRLFMVADIARLCDRRSCGPFFGHRFWLRFGFHNSAGILANSLLFRSMVAASMPQIVDGLKDSNDSAVRTAAASTLGELSEQGAFRSLIGASIPQIMNFLKDNKSSDIRKVGVRSLVILSKQAEFRDPIQTSVCQIVDSLHDKDSDTRIAGAEALAKLSEQAEFRSLIRASIPQIVDLLKDKTSWVCEESANTLGKLSEQADFQESILVSIPRIVDLFEDDTGCVCGAAATTLAKFSEQVQFREFIPAAIPGMIMDLLKGNHESDVRNAAANAVGKLSEQTKFQASIRACIPLILDFLKDDDWSVRDAGKRTLVKLSEQASLRQLIRSCIPQIVELINDENKSVVRGAAAITLAKLSNQADLRESIRATIPSIIDLLRDSYDSDVRMAASYALAKLAKRAEFRECIQTAIPQVVIFLTDANYDVREAGAIALGKLAEQAEFQAPILASITQIANCLTDDYWTVCRAGATTLVNLSKKAEFREAVRAFIPRIVDLLKNNHGVIRRVGAHTLAKLWTQDDFHSSLCLPELRLCIPTVLADHYMSDALDFSQLVADLLVHDYFRDKILETLIFAMKSLYSVHTQEQTRGVYIITALEKHAIFVPMLKEIWAIYAFTHDVLTDTSLEQAATLVNQMAHYGILKTL